MPELPGSSSEDSIEELPSRRLTREEQMYRDVALQEPVKSIDRLEDVAKFLIGATATASGLLIAALKIAQGTEDPSTGIRDLLPFLLWSLSLVSCLLVVAPRTYQTGRRQPSSWKTAVISARQWKFHCLTCGMIFFILGILSAAGSFF
ncbi:MAG: hypothetical protein KC592_16700 [Nitrospira sp.]|nr:hypothetical protein [Nitrospira sp.]